MNQINWEDYMLFYGPGFFRSGFFYSGLHFSWLLTRIGITVLINLFSSVDIVLGELKNGKSNKCYKKDL